MGNGLKGGVIARRVTKIQTVETIWSNHHSSNLRLSLWSASELESAVFEVNEEFCYWPYWLINWSMYPQNGEGKNAFVTIFSVTKISKIFQFDLFATLSW